MKTVAICIPTSLMVRVSVETASNARGRAVGTSILRDEAEVGDLRSSVGEGAECSKNEMAI